MDMRIEGRTHSFAEVDVLYPIGGQGVPGEASRLTWTGLFFHCWKVKSGSGFQPGDMLWLLSLWILEEVAKILPYFFRRFTISYWYGLVDTSTAHSVENQAQNQVAAAPRRGGDATPADSNTVDSSAMRGELFDQ
jgi:hypothetical protein